MKNLFSRFSSYIAGIFVSARSIKRQEEALRQKLVSDYEAMLNHQRNENLELSNIIGEYKSVMDQLLLVCSAAAQGDLEKRMRLTQPRTELVEICANVNRLIDIADAFVREASTSLVYASNQKFFRRVILRGLPGVFRQASSLINAASEEMARENKALISAKEQRQKLAHEFDNVTKLVYGFTEASQKVEDAVSLITNIANKTQFLSINASIEAARAGSSGKCFAVVALEVGSLADQTTEITSRINEELKKHHDYTNYAFQTIEGIASTVKRLS